MSEINPDQEQDDTNAKGVYIIVLIISTLLFTIGHLLHADYPMWSVFVKELSFAGFIALILIGTIERFTRNRHEKAANRLVKRINNDLFHAIYERYIPPKVLSEVEKALMGSNVYRENHEVNYTIDNLDDSEKLGGLPCDRHVKCSIVAMYNLKNITDHSVKHDIELNLERPIDPEWEVHCKITEVEIDGQALASEDIAEQTSLTPAQIKFSHTVTLKPREVVPVITKATLIKRKLDQEVWSSRLPSDGIKLIVTVPARDLDVRAHAHHHEELKRLLGTGVSTTWELGFGMFPHQSVVFWWSPKQPLACPKD
ncbi:MAG: hypothetical protein AB1642_13390 [Pseudomonadota bacterium]